MAKVRSDLMGALNASYRKWIPGRTMLVLFLLGAGLGSALLGCSLGVEDKAPPAVTARAMPAPGPSAEKPAAPPAKVKEETLEAQAFRVQDLRVREERGQTVLQVKFIKPVDQYRHFPLAQPSRIVLDIFGETKRLGEVQTFRVDTHWLGILRLSSSEGYLRLVLEIAAATVPAYVITPEDGGLRVVVGTVDDRVTAKRELELIRGGKRADVIAAEAKAVQGEPGGQPLAPMMTPKEEKRHTGQKISLDFKDADIKNIFRLLAEVSGLNIVVTDDVRDKVTIRLVDVPWDQALDLIIDTNGLAKEELGNVLRISTAARLRKEREELLAARKAAESVEIPQTSFLSVNYGKARDLVERIKPIVPTTTLIIPDDRSNMIVVRGNKKAVEDVTEMVSRLDTRTPQVLIESNLIETTPTFARALGFRLQFERGGARFTGAAGAGTPFSGSGASFPELPGGLGGTVSIIQSSIGGLRNLASSLEAAEREGNIKIISRPSVVTLNNVPSTIQSLRVLRVTLPASTNIASGTGAAAGAAVATERINVGIVLSVTPQVSSDGFVLMNINVKSSTIAESATVADSTSVVPFDELSREAISNVLVRDGETIVIGGIMKDTRATSESGIPFLKDIPLLGWLFKNRRWQKDFEELMVFITPRIMAAGSENLPTAEQLWREQMSKTQGG